MEPRQQVALDGPDQGHLDRDHLHRRPLADEHAGGPWDDAFDRTYVNYAPIVLGVLLIAVSLGWLKARSHFTGQERNIDAPVAEEFAPAAGGPGRAPDAA